MRRRSQHCNQFRQTAITRRQWLAQASCGFGSVALAGLMADPDYAGLLADDRISSQPAGHAIANRRNPLEIQPTHFPARAKRVIYLYMDGGPSQVDTWDPKPRLTKDDGKPFAMRMEPTQFNNNGNTMASPWKFKNHGESGIPCSELFPNIAKHVDDFSVIRSMVSEFSEHTNANYFLHTGNGFQGRPGMGAWVGMGLGTECQELPGYVVLNGGLIPPGGLDCFNSGFLPAAYQGSIFNSGNMPVANIRRREATDQLQREKLNLMRSLDQQLIERTGRSDDIESAIANYELAYRMQSTVPELTAISDETAATQEMYGLNHPNKATGIFARQCLIARRLVERGVRFVELTCPKVGHDRWDQHGKIKQGHEDNALVVDQPIGALLADLKQRGLFDDTLVIWSGEFGRTPFAQGSGSGRGRDHNPFGFSLWMAGGGIKGGYVHGATDEYGYKVIQDRVEIHDLHATMLHLLGMDHERLVYRFSGRDMRLTDVHGRLVEEILA